MNIQRRRSRFSYPLLAAVAGAFTMAGQACGGSGGDSSSGSDAAANDAQPGAPTDGTSDANAVLADASTADAATADAADATPTDATSTDATPPLDAATKFALNFDARIPQYVSIPSAARLALTTQFTYELWVNATTNGGVVSLITKAFGHQHGDTTALWFEGGNLHAGVNIDSTSNTVTYVWPTTNNGSWHHVAWTYDDGTKAYVLYVDGLSVATGTNANGTPVYDTHPFQIGADIDYDAITYGFDGKIDEVRIFSTVRTSTQIAADKTTSSPVGDATLVAAFSFDEGVGATAHDSSLNHFDGTLGTIDAGASAPTWVTSTVP